MLNIRGFELIEPPYRGGMAMVYQGRKGNMRKAFKLLQPDKVANNPRLSEMFLNEISMQSQLNHPNIVNIHDAYPYQMNDGRTVTVLEMEWLDGMDLQSYIEKRNGGRGLDVPTVKRIALQVCKGMLHAHGKNILHLDLKPSNIFRTVDGYVKIIDFGIAKVVGDNASMVEGAQNVTMMTTTGQSTFKGTLAYSSPEQQVGGKLSYTSDIYSFGQTLHYLLTGTTDPDVMVSDSLMSAIVDRCTERAPKRRYQSFQEVADAIEGKAGSQVKCRNSACGRMLDASFKVCPYCGTKVESEESHSDKQQTDPQMRTCPHCHKSTSRRYRFCTECGHRFTTEPPAQKKTDTAQPSTPPVQSGPADCPYCKKRIWIRADGMTRFCTHCGRTLPWMKGEQATYTGAPRWRRPASGPADCPHCHKRIWIDGPQTTHCVKCHRPI